MGLQPKRRARVSAQDGAAMPSFTGPARPKYVMGGNVYDAALDRIRWLFDEFDNQVTVSNSGGKDSTVVVELALIVARERNALPLKVQWLDQECEYQATRDYQRYLADRDDVDFLWYQIPFRLFNATNHADPWLNVWGKGEAWVRDKEPDSIHDNPFFDGRGRQIERFKEVLRAMCTVQGGAHLSGIRGEESPGRRVMLTSTPNYKWVTWGNGNSWPYKMFHPIYDWTYRDVWKAIHDNGWRYNTFYDVQFQHGVSLRDMRVSNYHHETAMWALHYLQEAEPQTWERATQRLEGINTLGHLQRDIYVTELPYMFASWEEYLHHLIDNLVPKEEYREMFRKMYASARASIPDHDPDHVTQMAIRAVLRNDLYGTTMTNFVMHNKPGRAWQASQAAYAAREHEEALL